MGLLYRALHRCWVLVSHLLRAGEEAHAVIAFAYVLALGMMNALIRLEIVVPNLYLLQPLITRVESGRAFVMLMEWFSNGDSLEDDELKPSSTSLM